LGKAVRALLFPDAVITAGTGEAMTATRMRTIGRWAAFVAAYAVVFNVILTSALVATVSPSKANTLHELCLNGSSGVPSANGDSTGKPIIHCPLCHFGLAATIDLPPASPALAIRVALDLSFEIVLRHDQAPSRPPANDHRPRGPPVLS
jgi:hypothetical protein